MSQNQPNAGRTFSMRALMLGFGLTLVLALVSMTFIVVELGHAQQRTIVLADEGQHATYYLGDVGEQLARLRAQVALGLQETHEELGRRAEHLSQVEATLQADIDGLGFGLGPGQPEPAARRAWDALRPDIQKLRRTYADAASFMRTGQASRAAELLAREAPLATRIHDGLDEIAQHHRQTMLHELSVARGRVAFARLLAVYAGGVFTLAMLGIWALVFRKLRRQGRRLVDANTRLESANADLDAFAGRVAHDLKNALWPVVMAPTMLRRSATDATRVLEVADRTERCSRRAIAVLDALLAFSRAAKAIEGGESGALQSAVKNVVEELAPKAGELGVSVEVEELPNVNVRCSPGLLHIVLSNLCGNAVKYLEGEPERRVRISAHAEDSLCRIEVEDTGPGIPKDAQEKIFEPFFRVEGVRAPGTGIGLATVHRIVDTRGGHVAVESVEGKGSRFIVWLPMAPPPEDRPSQPLGAEVRPFVHH